MALSISSLVHMLLVAKTHMGFRYARGYPHIGLHLQMKYSGRRNLLFQLRTSPIAIFISSLLYFLDSLLLLELTFFSIAKP